MQSKIFLDYCSIVIFFLHRSKQVYITHPVFHRQNERGKSHILDRIYFFRIEMYIEDQFIN